MEEQAEEEKILTGENAVDLDLSAIRGIQPPEEQEEHEGDDHDDQHPNTPRRTKGDHPSKSRPKSSPHLHPQMHSHEEFQLPPHSPEKKKDLEALAELVPGLKIGKIGKDAVQPAPGPGGEVEVLMTGAVSPSPPSSPDKQALPHLDSMMVNQGIDEEYDEDGEDEHGARNPMNMAPVVEEEEEEEDENSQTSDEKTTNELIEKYQKAGRPKSKGKDAAHLEASSSSSDSSAGKTHASDEKGMGGNPTGPTTTLPPEPKLQPPPHTGNDNQGNPTPYQNYGQERVPETPPRDADESYYGTTPSPGRINTYHLQSSAASLSTATQSHEMRMPMYLPNFRPATGCTNASDFIVRCFVARLRAGITVVKHGRSRWCKSRLRVLHVHSDGRSLSWKPAQGEPNSNKRPPKLDLSTCLEVRHAWSPDPLNPMFTGTPILRAKCEPTNAFKSFALIFPRRTVDITAVTADQCKVLMEGFSALCFRLQVANMAGRGRGMVNAEGEGENKDEKMTASTAIARS